MIREWLKLHSEMLLLGKVKIEYNGKKYDGNCFYCIEFFDKDDCSVWIPIHKLFDFNVKSSSWTIDRYSDLNRILKLMSINKEIEYGRIKVFYKFDGKLCLDGWLTINPYKGSWLSDKYTILEE